MWILNYKQTSSSLQSLSSTRSWIFPLLPYCAELLEPGDPGTGGPSPQVKSDNLQYDMLDRWVDHLINQASDGPGIILID